MMWSDTGVVLSSQKYGENYKMVSILTENHGKVLGLSRILNRNSFSLLSNVSVDMFKKNSSYNLGFWTKKHERQNWIYIFGSELHIMFCQSICLMLDKTLPQGVLYTNIFNFLTFLTKNLNDLSEEDIYVLHIYFEFLLLKETGFGFDIRHDVHFISPKTGRTVSENMGFSHKDKLFEMPKIWHKWNTIGEYREVLDAEICNIELLNSLKISWYFINKNICIIQNSFRDSIISKFSESPKFPK
ncbi:MAG: recombination protein O N-terminal domain-containing protein, partial [Holosporales bacterium]|nr:recombination protein O N-terminal domain-containing protein [Holosporales bacterium]